MPAEVVPMPRWKMYDADCRVAGHLWASCEEEWVCVTCTSELGVTPTEKAGERADEIIKERGHEPWQYGIVEPTEKAGEPAEKCIQTSDNGGAER